MYAMDDDPSVLDGARDNTVSAVALLQRAAMLGGLAAGGGAAARMRQQQPGAQTPAFLHALCTHSSACSRRSFCCSPCLVIVPSHLLQQGTSTTSPTGHWCEVIQPHPLHLENHPPSAGCTSAASGEMAGVGLSHASRTVSSLCDDPRLEPL